MTALATSIRPRIGTGFRLQWEPAQDAHVLLFPEGQVKLNGSAGEIMKRCDGERSVETAFTYSCVEKRLDKACFADAGEASEPDNSARAAQSFPQA